MEYIIVTAQSFELLVIKVNKKIDDGYKPQGGVAVTKLYHDTYAQAMVKKEQEELQIKI